MARFLLWPMAILALLSPVISVSAQSDSPSATVIDPSAIAQDNYDNYEPPEGLSSGKRNPIYYFGHDFSTFFVELSGLVGVNDRALGFSMAYIPEVWGGYASFHEGRDFHWFAAGAEYRLSSPWHKTDWHLYGGVSGGDGLGGELGIRLAANSIVNQGKFGMFSGSVGVRVVSGGVYITGGISVGLAAAATLLWLVF
ncbi:MAG: hypothetical protein IJ764_04565 [Bacteroidales bacterium]|nr:hypothetical protein [Bacteroidales bacterium]